MSQPIEIAENPMIPENQRPKSPKPEIKNDALVLSAEKKLSKLEVAKIKEQLPVVVFSQKMQNELRQIGIDAERFGVAQTDRGGLMVMQQAILTVTGKLMQRAEKTKSQPKLIIIGKCIAMLAKALAECSVSTTISTTAEAEVDDKRVRRASPAKGAIMGGGPEISIVPEQNAG